MTSYRDRKMISDSKGIGVIADYNESFESMMKRFKRLVSKSGIMKDITKNRYYEKNSEKKKRRISESIKRNQKRERN